MQHTQFRGVLILPRYHAVGLGGPVLVERVKTPLFSFLEASTDIWHKVWMNWATYHHRRLQTAKNLISRRNNIAHSECWSRIFFVPLQSSKRGRNLAETQGRHNLKSNLRKSGQDSESGWRDWCSLFVFVSYRCKPLYGTHTSDMK